MRIMVVSIVILLALIIGAIWWIEHSMDVDASASRRVTTAAPATSQLAGATTRSSDFAEPTNVPGQMAFIEAAKRGDLVQVRQMLANDPDLANVADGSGRTPLHAAAWNGRLEVARLLLDTGADPDVKDLAQKGTPLEWAAWSARAEMVKLIVEHGATIPHRLLGWSEQMARGRLIQDHPGQIEQYKKIPSILRAAGAQETPYTRFLAMLWDEPLADDVKPDAIPGTAPPPVERWGLLNQMRVMGVTARWRDEGVELSAADNDFCGAITNDIFTTPLTIHVQAKTNGENLRVMFSTGQIIFNWEEAPTDMGLIDPLGLFTKAPGKGKIPVDQFVKIDWVFTDKEMRVLVDGDLRHVRRGNYAGLKGRVAVGPAWGSTVTVRSVEVSK